MGKGRVIETDMAVEINSKHGVVSKAPYELYMVFADMRNFVQFLPEDKKEGVTAEYDTLNASVQGFNIGVKVVERTPYSVIGYADDGAPFKFGLTLHFDPVSDPYKTDFHVHLSADLNFMMKTLLGSKLQEGIDRVVDALVAMSAGKMPEDMGL